MPKWTTPIRQLHLARLFETYGNRCLFGHIACQDVSHYIHVKLIPVLTVVPKDKACIDLDGNPICDQYGNRLYITEYGTKVDRVAHIEFTRLYDVKTDVLIKSWIADDRESRGYELRRQTVALHRLNEKGSLRGRFNAISRTIFFDTQPRYYFEAYGISGLTFLPFAVIRLSSSLTRLHVDISEPLKKVSKNKRRKAVRYCKALPVDVQREVDTICKKAVKAYLNI